MVFKINIKSFTSIIVSKLVLKSSKFLLNGGSNFPGKIALKIDRNILSTIAHDYNVILVTGTNGKTTTTSMIYNIIKSSGKNVITNDTGANMFAGITASFIKHYRFFSSNKEEKYAVIEVDEANVKFITEYITPKAIIITNLFRDQLDRYGEVYTTLNKIMEGVIKSPSSTLILNGDESLLGDLTVPNPKIYYGFNCDVNNTKKVDLNADAKFCKKCKAPYKYEFITYNHLGNFYCSNCGYKRPNLNYFIDNIIKLSSDSSTVSINSKEFIINQPGVYNIYNGLCAYSSAKCLNISDDIIYKALSSQKSSFGRQENILIEDKKVKIILVKNPAGYNEAINTVTLDKRNITAAFLLNDNYADGRDVSWIWDVDFEKLNTLNINKVIVSGIRLYDMAIRLKVSGLDYNKFDLCADYEQVLKSIIDSKEEQVYVLATYTAMINFRKFLHSKGYINILW